MPAATVYACDLQSFGRLIYFYPELRSPSRGRFKLVSCVAKGSVIRRDLDTRNILAIELVIVAPGQSVDNRDHVLGREAFAFLIKVSIQRAHHVVQSRRSARVVKNRQVEQGSK